MRVSLRPPRYWRTLISAAIPVCTLLAFATVVGGVLSVSRLGVTLAMFAGLCVLSVVGIRALVMVIGSASSRDWLRAIAVAAAYESGRALALTAPFGHNHRRRGA